METFGNAVRRLRGTLSLRELARRAYLDPGHLSKIENGGRLPTPAVAEALDKALDAGGTLVTLALSTREQTRLGRYPLSAEVSLRSGLYGDDAVSIGGLPASNVTEMTLTYLEVATSAAISDSERMAPRELYPQVIALHHQVQYLLHGTQHPPQRARLYAVGVYLSGLLGTLALDTGRWRPARVYAQTAYDLAVFADEPDLQSWARATQSLIAYYTGDYVRALDLARDGQRLARRGIHSVRLTVNGEARALARLHDRAGVDEAVQRTFELLETFPQADGVSASLTTGVYCPARAAANAATAYLLLAEPTRVDDHVQRAITAFDEKGLRGPQALSRLDLATALLMPGGDLERACAVARQAMTVTGSDAFASVTLRAHEFLALAQPWHRQPAVREIHDLVSSTTSASMTGPGPALPSPGDDDRAGQP